MLSVHHNYTIESIAKASLSNDYFERWIEMDQLKDLLVDDLQDLLHAEMQLVEALPEMAEAANNPKLKEAFEKHLQQTQSHVERLKSAFELLGEKPQPKPCKGMQGLIAEGQETIEENKEEKELPSDLALIGAAQKVEHYEISGYGTARYLARQMGEREVATMLSHTLGEEESSDYLLSELSKSILQDALSMDAGSKPVPIAKTKTQRA
jgi:Mn-containing catalase